MKMGELPKGWAEVAIAECIPNDGLFIDGDWIESKDQDPNGDVRLIQLADIGDGSFRNKSNRYLTSNRANELNCTFLKEGDILVARMPDPLGRACIFPLKGLSKYITAVDVAILRLNNKSVLNNYLVHSINNRKTRNDIEKYQSGTTRKRISRKNLALIRIPLPPLSEQHRIVAKIEELFSSLDKGIESLKTARLQLKVYRQAVLKWAFEGRFTNRNVKEGELPEGWRWVRIDEVASIGTGATPLKSNKEYYNNGQSPWIKSSALNHDYVDFTSDFVTEKAVKETNLSIYKRGTLLLAMYGEGKTRGKCSELRIEACTNQAIAAIHFENHDNKIKTYLKYFLLKNYEDIRKLASGGVQPNLNLGIVKKTRFPLPPTIEEQQAIISEIEDRLSVCDKMEESISQSLEQAEALRQSILKKAFEGKLVPQDPNDEPASVLLERIRAEREKTQAGKLVKKSAGRKNNPASTLRQAQGDKAQHKKAGKMAKHI